MKNERRPEGYGTSDINIAALLLTIEGTSFLRLEGEEDQRLFVLNGNSDILESKKNDWFKGQKVIGDVREFVEHRKYLLRLLKR